MAVGVVASTPRPGSRSCHTPSEVNQIPSFGLLDFRRESLGIDANGSTNRLKFKKPDSIFGPLEGQVGVLTALSPAAAFFLSLFDSSFAPSRAFWASATWFWV